MTITKKPLSLKKETLKTLKVRTDLKGGLASAKALGCCTVSHHCSMR